VLGDLEKRWQEVFNSGFYSQVWGWRIDPEKTRKEVESLVKLLKLPPGARILDWCGGWGRHAILLALMGFKVTLLDYSSHHIKLAKKAAKEAGVRIKTFCIDFRATPTWIQADYAVNLFTSGLGYLSEEDDLQALRSLYLALKPGAKFLLDTISLFWLAINYQPLGWYESEDKKRRVLERREFDFLTNRNQAEFIYQEVGGTEKEQQINLRIYSPADLAALLRQAGFRPLDLYGDLDGSPFTFESKRIVLVSERR